MSLSGTESVWMSDVTLPHFPTLDHLAELDVLIVGGGISGLTAGVLLQRGGYRTAILEQDRLGSGETGRTSAHLTEFPDVGYAQLAADIGIDGARAVAQSKRAAMRQIEGLAHEMSCDYERVTGYLFSELDGDVARLRDECTCAREAGLRAQRLERAPLPFATGGAVAFSNQAQFHPLKYLHGLIRLYAEAGGTISERTHVRAIDEAADICHVRTERTTLHCRQVVAVTDAPITGGTLLETKLRANRSSVIALAVADAHVAPGLFWDTDDPYHYIRTAATADGPLVIVGGEDHRVGTDGETEAFERLEEYATTRFAGAMVVRRWSGQILEPIDGLPYIGRREENSRVFLATGYAGNGLTFGTLAAQILVDAIAGRENPYAPLYAPDRLLGAKQWAKYAAQNLPAAWTLVTDMLPLPVLASADDLKPGEGRILRIAGDKVAAARDGDGMLHAVSPTCTHMGCEVAWNVVEQTWDCPCHGSRYDMDGAVLHGPATAPLEALSATAGKSRR
jgi:glycine/D-amino acid oxidase-like deaminating enzyme/nitrite reductase/ring-hydroxylating ferredoxin subunit